MKFTTQLTNFESEICKTAVSGNAHLVNMVEGG